MDTKEFLKKLAVQKKRMEDNATEIEKLDKEGKVIAAELKKLENPVFALSGFVAAYMKAVAGTDGLVSVMPSCLKSLQAAEKSATVKSVTEAAAALDEQMKSAMTEAKTDPEKKMAAVNFLVELDKMKKKIKALL